MENTSLYPQVLGVFSRVASASVGAGTTAATRESTTYWLARRLGDDRWEVQPLNQNHVPSGGRMPLSKGAFMEQYIPEPRYYEQKTLPALRTLREKIAQGEEHYAEGRLDQAEKEFAKALMLDDKNVPANLGAGAVWLDKGEMQKVGKVLDVLLYSDETFKAEQRTLFNRFGISLRKKGLFDFAAAYYSKALEMNPGDEHLHFNLARVHFDRGDPKASRAELGLCLQLNPGLDVAHKFLEYLGRNHTAVSGRDPSSLGLDAAPLMEE